VDATVAVAPLSPLLLFAKDDDDILIRIVAVVSKLVVSLLLFRFENFIVDERIKGIAVTTCRRGSIMGLRTAKATRRVVAIVVAVATFANAIEDWTTMTTSSSTNLGVIRTMELTTTT
jgi:hypothetical protein